MIRNKAKYLNILILALLFFTIKDAAAQRANGGDHSRLAALLLRWRMTRPLFIGTRRL